MNNHALSPAEHFVERMGVSAEEEGLPRICGRLMGLILLEGGPFSFEELAERLQVSRSSVSTNARILESRGIIERAGLPGDRHTYYRVAGDPYHGMISALLRRKRQAKRIIEETLDQLGSEEAERRARLEALHRFHELVVSTLEEMMERWKSESAAAGTAG
ncbi:MAG: GbsR/MarR family transcriptional regulator [Gemmatimonadota bacterium]